MTADLLTHAVAPHHLRLFLAGDRKAAVSAIVSSCAGWTQDGAWGQVSVKGIGLYPFTGDRDVPLAFVTWREVGEAIDRGARPELIEAFRAADALWAEWVAAGGYGAYPHHRDLTDAERAAVNAHQDAFAEASRALRAATAAIIAAGYADAPVQGDLFEGVGA